MTLASGTRLGPYEVTGAIGAGGMGEVFRARDTKLNRDVAIKVLPAAFADDPERLARFTREAQTLASLNHPNVGAIYGVEDVPAAGGAGAGSRALVMELVEGEDLSIHIARGPIPIAEALPIARQIAEALEAAHEQGIVHRDLKPANIKVRTDGTVKVLDFGLAKAMDQGSTSSSNPNVSHSPTLTHQGTSAGLIIGTAAYMSPEQAKGKAVDKRADIWAFGVVLYEMLTGRRAFKGEDVSDTLASVLKDTLPLDTLPSGAPPQLRRLVGRCVERDLRTRLRDIGEARIELMRLENGAFDPLAPSGVATASDTAARAGGSRTAWAVAAVAGMALGILALRHFSEASPEPPVMHVSLPLPARGTGFLSLSPDGRRVLASNNNLAIRDIDGNQWTYIESARGARAPFWSPDGRFVGFFADGKLKTVSVAGGPARELCGEDVIATGGAWRSDGVILFSGRVRPMIRVSAEGGACTPVMKVDAQRNAAFPEFLPDGDHYLYTGQIRGDLASRGVYVGSLKDPDAVPLSGKKILDDYSSVSFAPPVRPGEPGHLLFLRGSTLMAQPFDAGALTLRGDPFPVASDAHVSLTQPDWAGGPGGGNLVYGTNLRPTSYQLTWIDRSGKRLSDVGAPGDHRSVALSGNGGFATVLRRDDGIHLYDLARNTEARISSDADPSPAVWSRDGSHVVYSSTIDGVRGLYRREGNGSGKEEMLLPSPVNTQAPADLSGTGALLFTERDAKTGADIWYWPRPGDPSSKPEKFLATGAMESQPQLSPDGRWIAYLSNESGRVQLYVRQFPSGPGFARIGTGFEPRWKGDGSELFFLDLSQGFSSISLMAVSIKTDGQNRVSVGEPVSLFKFASFTTVPENNSWVYAPSPDGRRFLVALRTETGEPTIHLITNWLKAARGPARPGLSAP